MSPIRIFIALLAFCAAEPSLLMPQASAQSRASQAEARENQSLDKNAIERAVAAELKLEGVVIARKKYSFTVLQDGTAYEVKLADDAPIALSMTKPWFDWENDQVVVDAKTVPDSVDAATEPAVAKRVAVKLPAAELHLISRFATLGNLKEFLAAETKRINFYLLTPKQVETHFPTEQEPFLAGKLRRTENQLLLAVDDQEFPVKLGFRLATINGFSINELKPHETYVVLAGRAAGAANEVIAARVLFQPLAVTDANSNSTGK